MKIGTKVTFFPKFKGTETRAVTGTVILEHPRGRFVLVEYNPNLLRTTQNPKMLAKRDGLYCVLKAIEDLVLDLFSETRVRYENLYEHKLCC